MPLLPLEPFVFPDDLLTASPLPENEAERWWVLHTRPRAEKALARLVLGHKLPFFLPLYKRQWRSRGRLLSSHLPLFPGYVFLRGDSEGRLRALETNLVANCLPVGDQDRLTADLKDVFTLMASGSALSPEDRLQPGTQVEIVSGPLAGIEGRIIRRGKNVTFFVEVQFLQQGVSVEIESWMFRPVDAPRPAESVR
ncbi:MAG TPA: transcription termination/antitermination NusG family protein [Gemmataceae bacterium]|nr:transcription termination/antitermination NusG family protein [Gemmataceae bacterium]